MKVMIVKEVMTGDVLSVAMFSTQNAMFYCLLLVSADVAAHQTCLFQRRITRGYLRKRWLYYG